MTLPSTRAVLGAVLLLGSALASSGCIALLGAKPLQLGSEDLAGTRWLVQTIDGVSVPVDTISSLDFDGLSAISGSGGCNRYSATVGISGMELIPGPISIEGPPCRPEVMDVQARFLAALEATRTFALGDSSLSLNDGNGTQRLGLSRVPPAP